MLDGRNWNKSRAEHEENRQGEHDHARRFQGIRHQFLLIPPRRMHQLKELLPRPAVVTEDT